MHVLGITCRIKLTWRWSNAPWCISIDRCQVHPTIMVHPIIVRLFWWTKCSQPTIWGSLGEIGACRVVCACSRCSLVKGGNILQGVLWWRWLYTPYFTLVATLDLSLLDCCESSYWWFWKQSLDLLEERCWCWMCGYCCHFVADFDHARFPQLAIDVTENVQRLIKVKVFAPWTQFMA